MTHTDPHAELAAIRAELTARLAAQKAETDADMCAAIQKKIDGLIVQRDKIERQINMGDGGTYFEKVGNVTINLPDKDLAETDLRREYLNRLMTQLNRVKLVGSDDAAARMKLSSVYTALMSRNVYLSGLGRESVPDEVPANIAVRDGKKISLLEELNDERHLVILGGPGSGKSTFTNFVVLCMAGELRGSPDANLAVLTRPLPAGDDEEEGKPKLQPWEHGALLPVLIELRDFAESLPPPNTPLDPALLETYVLGGIAPADYQPHLKKALLKTGCLVILDGLDEVPDANNRRAQVKQAVQDFVSLHSACRVLVTSRTYAYQNQDWRLEGFASAEIAPLAPQQVRAFVDAWYAHLASPAVGRLSEADAIGRAAHLKNRISNDARIAELTERPLLLTLIARLHLENQGDLPSDREPVYDASVKLLLNDWERQKLRPQLDGTFLPTQPSLTEYLKVNNDELQKTLQVLAFEAHRDQADLKGLANIAREKLELALLKLARNEKANPLELESYLRDRAGILVSHGNDTYQFPHRTFQEYLSARHLAIAPEFPQPLCGLAMAEPTRWREALLLVAARNAVNAPLGFWALIEELCPIDPPSGTPDEIALWGAALAAQALLETGYAERADVAARDRAKRERVRCWTRVIVERGLMTPFERAQAGKALAVLGDDRPGVSVIAGVPDIDWVEIPDTASFVYGEGRTQQTLPMPMFKIARYPVTVAQFRAFCVAEDGFKNSAWWAGLSASDQHKSQYEDPSFEHDNHPAHNASWYDAVAFCRWLTHKTGLRVSLPTEQQWERAARGQDGRAYPWGPDYIAGYANIDETESGSEVGPDYLRETSTVGMYPIGHSPDQILDMAGNVWEWCLNEHDDSAKIAIEGGAARVLRGGSWGFNLRIARCASRGRFDGPTGRYDSISAFGSWCPRLIFSNPLADERSELCALE